MKDIIWTDKLTESFIEKGALSADEAFIMRTRVRGYCVSYQAQHLHKSESTIARMISSIKKRYDVVQREYPDEFPVRRKSKVEKWMDEN